ncbi:MAG TPA: hypothetical protein VJ953_16435 [Saprospiraceae bacterium]|nr:hypothetical protein [Saprospiraceae bacterium]
MQELLTYQWWLIVLASLALFFIAPIARTSSAFFRATVKNKAPNAWVLTSSLVISWIFAKSITNAANLGLSFGIVGGLAYSAYYLSFLVAGWIIYRMRMQGKFASIHQFLKNKYGPSALVVFSLLIAFRLFNEVWSNTMVIGSYFGDQGSRGYYWAIVVFTLLTLAYVIKGGLQSSLLTDVIQMVLFGVLLFIILGVLLPKEDNDLGRFVSSGTWTLAGGLDLLLVALIQVFSYPFHDPVLTDRAFIASPKVTLRSFIVATFIGMLCIVLFSFVGIYAQFRGMEGQAAVKVSRSLGLVMALIMNFIMVTSAASTLDSTFSSFAKLIVVDLGPEKQITVQRGRLAMILLTIIGTIPVFLSPTILSATTISGTMVLGLAPVFLFWKKDFPPLSFHLSIGAGLLMGIIYATGKVPDSWIWFEGTYAGLLAVNLIGTILSFSLFFIGKFLAKAK